jgi:hypothetical protein
VTAENGATTSYTVTCIVNANTETDILTFGFAGQPATVDIDSENHAIAIVFPFGADITGLLATFTLSTGATAKIGETPQTSGVTQNDFTGQLVYTITAQDNTVFQNWTVTSTIAAE